MSGLMDEFREQIRNFRGESSLSRKNVEGIHDTVPETVLCASCYEVLPKGHWQGDRDINGKWEPFCLECLDVIRFLRKQEERNAE
jgi:hypothetical protein